MAAVRRSATASIRTCRISGEQRRRARRRPLRCRLARPIERLAVQVRLLDAVVIDDDQPATPAAARYCSTGQPSPPAPTTSTARGAEAALTGGAHFRRHALAAVTMDHRFSPGLRPRRRRAICACATSGCAARARYGHYRRHVRSGGEYPRKALERQPTDGHERHRAYAPLPFADARKSSAATASPSATLGRSDRAPRDPARESASARSSSRSSCVLMPRRTPARRSAAISVPSRSPCPR